MKGDSELKAIGVPVSLLMSLYIKENPKYLLEALESICEQKSYPQQVVIVLDGPILSEHQQILDQFISNYIGNVKVVPLVQNQGLGVALAIGVEACDQELIARMDTDDIMTSDRIEKEYEQFCQQTHLGIVGSNICEFSETTTNILGYRKVPEHNDEIRNFSKRRNPFNHMTVMYRKADVLKAGNYCPLPGFEDYYLWVRMLKHGTVGYNIQENLVFARTGVDMYSRRGGIRYLAPGLKARKRIYQEGLGSFSDFIFVSFVHLIVSLMPNKLRGFFYEKKLRN